MKKIYTKPLMEELDSELCLLSGSYNKVGNFGFGDDEDDDREDDDNWDHDWSWGN